MKKAAFLPANALARAIGVLALQTGASPEQSSYQCARDASIMTHSTMRISGNVHAAVVADIVEYYDNASKLIRHEVREK
jgi:hypothetical protein